MEEFKYKRIVDNSYDWETWMDQNHQLQYVSPSCQRISGYQAQEFLDNPNLFKSIIADEDLEIWKNNRQKIENSDKTCLTQFRIYHKDGYRVWIEYLCQAVIDENGFCLGYRANHRDISLYKESMETIIKNELQFERIIETLPLSLSIITLDGTVLYINPKALEYFEIKTDIIGQKTATIYWMEAEKRRLWIEQIKNEGIVTDFEMHLKTVSGKELWAIGSGIIIDYQGQACILSTHHDITERKEMERTLRESEEQYKLLFENAAESIVVIQDKKVVLSNDMATVLTGYSAEELSRLPFVHFIHPDDVDLVVNNHEKRLEDKVVDRIYNYRILKKDGQIRWVEMNSLKINLKGKPASFNLLSDITERKLAEDALRISEEKYRLLFENAVEAILVVQNEQIKMCNPMTTRLTGYSHGQLLKMKFTDFIHLADKENALVFHKKRLSGIEGSSKQQFRIIRKDQQIRWIESDGIKIDWNGEVATLQFAVDITERKATEDKILYLSFFDKLTGLYNRRFYEEELNRLNTKRNLPLTLLMADVNGLKLVNDGFGHKTGDRLLKAVAEIMQKELRADDILARIGGDEFIIILPKTDRIDGKLIMERLKEKIAGVVIDKITASVSFGFETKEDESEDLEKIFSRAEDYMYRRKLLESGSVKSEMITLITRGLYEKDKSEQLHSERVADLCQKTAQVMNFPDYQVAEIRLLGMFHDIGKVGLDSNILRGNAKLSDKEWCEIKKHPQTGYHILKSVSEFSHIAEYVLCHHERIDGSGYPRGLRGDDIPLQSRILAIAEAYDSMTKFHYKETLTVSEAVNELISNSGNQFDKRIVTLFIEKVID